MKQVLVDADQLPYSCGFASKGEPLSHTLQLVKKALMRIREETKVENLVLFIKGEGNFREDLAFTQGYKATRTAPKPDTYDEIRDYLKTTWGATEVHGMEADDMVSLLLWADYTENSQDRDRCNLILSSPDKDLNNTPGWHHYPRTGEVKWVSAYQASRHFHYQMLEGDNVDNIKGLPKVAMSDVHTYGLNKQAHTKGCGKASAKKLMEAASEPLELFIWERYMAWGKEEGLTPEEVKTYFIEQGQLLWMTRELDTLGDPVLYKHEEVYYEEAADRIYGEGVVIRSDPKEDGEDGSDDALFGGESNKGHARDSDADWESFCNGSDE